MRYTTDSPLTEDWIKSQNKFDRNTTNITIATREGIDFGDEPEASIGVESNDAETQKQYCKCWRLFDVVAGSIRAFNFSFFFNWTHVSFFLFMTILVVDC